jgi:uncharacterized protein (DUF849 family)
MAPTWIEVALNGRWGSKAPARVAHRRRGYHRRGVACVDAGAALLHVHAYDAGTEVDDPDVYARIIEGIQGRVDAIVYPTKPSPGIDLSGSMDPHAQFATHDELGGRGLLECSVVDPGSINSTTYDAVERDEPGDVYLNPEANVREGLAFAARHGAIPSYAIYEPGFIRLGAALAERFSALPTPIYQFMFSERFTFNYPPKPYVLESLHRLLTDEAGDAPWMLSGLGVDVTPLIPRAVELGGQVRVGLEDAPLGSGRTNVEWVEHAGREIEAAGGTVASVADVREALS